MLKVAYEAGKALFGTPAIGRTPIEATAANVHNHDVSEQVGGHGDYKTAALDFLYDC